MEIQTPVKTEVHKKIFFFQNNLLSLDIGRGLLLATCLPVGSVTANSSILFKAEFTHLVN